MPRTTRSRTGTRPEATGDLEQMRISEDLKAHDLSLDPLSLNEHLNEEGNGGVLESPVVLPLVVVGLAKGSPGGLGHAFVEEVLRSQQEFAAKHGLYIQLIAITDSQGRCPTREGGNQQQHGSNPEGSGAELPDSGQPADSPQRGLEPVSSRGIANGGTGSTNFSELIATRGLEGCVVLDLTPTADPQQMAENPSGAPAQNPTDPSHNVASTSAADAATSGKVQHATNPAEGSGGDNGAGMAAVDYEQVAKPTSAEVPDGDSGGEIGDAAGSGKEGGAAEQGQGSGNGESGAGTAGGGSGLLPAMVRAAELGCHAVIVGSQPQNYISALSGAFGPRLLYLDRAVSGSGGGSWLPENAPELLSTLASWYTTTEHVQKELARRSLEADADQQPGDARCACCVDDSEIARHAQALMLKAAKNPKAAVRRLKAGDYDMALGIGNLLFAAIRSNDHSVAQRYVKEGLLEATFAQLRAARASGPAHYAWYNLLLVAVNSTLFQGLQGDELRDECWQRGIREEIMIARNSNDPNIQRMGEHAIRMLRMLEVWLRPCANCGVDEQQPDAFKNCARCGCTAYCSKECQVAHWKAEHKGVCKLLAAL